MTADAPGTPNPQNPLELPGEPTEAPTAPAAETVSQPADAGQKAGAEPAKKPIPWRRILILGGVSLVLIGIAYVAIVNVAPRLWAQAIGAQVQKSMVAAIGWGLFYGFVFTLLPVLCLGLAVLSHFRRLWIRIALVVLAVLLAGPNLLALAVSQGTGGAAEAGRQILNVEAPFFLGANLVGVILGFVGGIAAVVFTIIRGRQDAEYRLQKAKAREQMAQAKADMKAARAAEKARKRAEKADALRQ